MVRKEPSRNINPATERELWARAAGRCQFEGCNRLLYRSSVTQELINAAQKAHIYSFSENGPRGWGHFRLNRSRLNDINNLILACHECHTKIDSSPDRYPAELLIEWKSKHEKRIERVTGINCDKKSHVVLYGANIGNEKTPIENHECVGAMFPHWYPSQERPCKLSMRSALKDCSPEFWQAEASHIEQEFAQKITPLIQDDTCKHFSLFALAPQPLLILLGSLFTDKISVETYQPRREPKGWRWEEHNDEFHYEINIPENNGSHIALVFSLSDRVSPQRVHNILGEDVSIWEITIADPHNDFLTTRHQLTRFRQAVRRIIVDIRERHGSDLPLHIFPVMPVACCIALGRARMPKADMPWVLYDQNFSTSTFVKSLEIRGSEIAKAAA